MQTSDDPQNTTPKQPKQIEFTDLPEVIQKDVKLILDFIVKQEGSGDVGTDDRGKTKS